MHLVLREGARFVGTDNGSGTHRFASMHLTNQILRFQHPPHAICQTQRNGHRKTFGHSHNDERNSNHDGLEEVRKKGQKVLGDGCWMLGNKEKRQARHNDQACYRIAGTGDERSQTLHLFVQRGFDAIINLGSRKHLSALCRITDTFHLEHAVSLHYLRALQHLMGGIGCGLISISRIFTLVTQRFTRQC